MSGLSSQTGGSHGVFCTAFEVNRHAGLTDNAGMDSFYYGIAVLYRHGFRLLIIWDLEVVFVKPFAGGAIVMFPTKEEKLNLLA